MKVTNCQRSLFCLQSPELVHFSCVYNLTFPLHNSPLCYMSSGHSKDPQLLKYRPREAVLSIPLHHLCSTIPKFREEVESLFECTQTSLKDIDKVRQHLLGLIVLFMLWSFLIGSISIIVAPIQ